MKTTCKKISILFTLATAWLLLNSGVAQAQQLKQMDVTQIRGNIEVIPDQKKVIGSIAVHFSVLQDTDSLYLDAIQMKIREDRSKDVAVLTSAKKIWLTGDFKAGQRYTADFTYEAFPKKTLYFTGDQFWTQGQGKYTSHWLPSLDDMNDKIEFDLHYIAPGRRPVVANGKRFSIEPLENETVWSYDMQQPMSSYLVAFASGDFDKLELSSASGVPLELYFRTEDASKAEPTYRYTREIFDFLEKEIGVAYPWQNYKQVPVRDFLYAGMENTTLTIFSEAFVVDSIGFVDRNYVNVNAHELAHQWFGNLVTETEGTHHWLHEGFATYYALLAERELFGEDYYYWKLLQSAEQLKALSEQGKGQSLLDPGASSLTFYEKGAWALHILKELIGEVAFKNAVTAYLNNHRYENVTTEDFLREVRKAAVTDIASWEADWLRQTAFQSEQAYASLMKSDFVRAYFEAKALRLQPFSEKEGALRDLLLNGNEYTGQEAVYQLAEVPMKKAIPLYQLALESEHLLVRQAVAESIPEIPNALKTGIEGMLEDGSYVSRELALSRLWEQFPNDRKRYLEATKYMEGFQNKNLKLLWLALAISSEAYGATANEIFVSELKTYASERFSFEVRQLAFDYLIRLQILDDEVMAHLINGSVHHYWRFRDVARQVLDEMWKVESFKTRLIEVLETVPEEERRYLRTKIESE